MTPEKLGDTISRAGIGGAPEKRHENMGLAAMAYAMEQTAPLIAQIQELREEIARITTGNKPDGFPQTVITE